MEPIIKVQQKIIDNNSTSKITQSVKLDSVELRVPSIQLKAFN